jgi:xanthine dehydrogenase large subunit
VWAAIAAHKLGRAVKLRLDRDDDFMITGKRHPFFHEYTAGFDDSGRLCGLQLTMAVNCGFSADLSGPVADRAVFHCDNAYFLEDVDIASYRCKLNTQSHTAFRGFGGPQGVIVIESIMSDIARHLGLDPLDVRLRNLYSDELTSGSADSPPAARNTTHYGMQVEDNILLPLLSKLELSAHYRRAQQAIFIWNSSNPVIRRGIAITPVKFGISFTATLFNQAGALVHVYLDGSMAVNHGRH